MGSTPKRPSSKTSYAPLVGAAIRQPKKRQNPSSKAKAEEQNNGTSCKSAIEPTDCRIDAKCRIDRGTPVTFTFDGRTYNGFAGDTLASALLANGVHLVGRSFKYHRPRGICPRDQKNQML